MCRFYIVLSALVAFSSIAPAAAINSNLRGSTFAVAAEKIYNEARRHLANDDAPNGIVLTTGDRFIFISLIVILALYFIYVGYSSATAPRRRVSIQGEKMAKEAAAAVAELHEVLNETDEVLKKAVTEMIRNERKEKSWTPSKWWSSYTAKDETARESIHADRALRESIAHQKSINVISEIIQAPGRERSGSISRKTMTSIAETPMDVDKHIPELPDNVNPLHTVQESSTPVVAPPAPPVPEFPVEVPPAVAPTAPVNFMETATDAVRSATKKQQKSAGPPKPKSEEN